MEKDEGFNEMQTVKRRFFAMRNGVVADVLRKAGSPFSVIFGLNLPQIVDIAREIGSDPLMAERLWANSSTRESMLLAPMLVAPEDFSFDDARRWCPQVPATEVADILCHRLLRRVPYALELARELLAAPDAMAHYTGLRLMCNIAADYPREAQEAAQAALLQGEPLTRPLAVQLLSAFE